MEEILKQIVIRLESMDKSIKAMETRSQKEFDSINDKLDRIERKMTGIPETYEMHEKIMGRHDRDIELLKKIILNQ